jgi:serine protease Do
MWDEPASAASSFSPDEQNNIDIYKMAREATVNITSRVYRQDWFFRVYPEEGTGSGFVINRDGEILTNFHVVRGSSQLTVRLSDQKSYKATVLGTDARNDLALIRIDAGHSLPTLRLGDSDHLLVGQKVLAIGNPFALEGTLTTGVVSSLNRGIESEDNRRLEGMIQTDAAINPGNSGGALVNDRGELIGMNTAIISHGSEGNQGIGFAIPVNMARNVMQQIVEHGKVTRGYLGIVPQDITPAISKAFNDTNTSGALVGDVSANSPAQKGGLERGDIITAVNGKPVADSNDLRMQISTMAPGNDVNLKVLRNGAQREIAVKLGELPGTEMAANHKSDTPGNSGSSALSGVSVENLDASSTHDLGLPANAQGVVVTNVNPSSAAADAGLRQGDVIQEVNHKPVKNTSDFEQAMRSSKGEPLLLVNRNGSTMFLAV